MKRIAFAGTKALIILIVFHYIINIFDRSFQSFTIRQIKVQSPAFFPEEPLNQLITLFLQSLFIVFIIPVNEKNLLKFIEDDRAIVFFYF